MRSYGSTARGGGFGGDVTIGKIVFDPKPRVDPPSPTRIRALSPEQQAEQDERRRKAPQARRRIARNHDFDRRQRQPATVPQEKIDRLIDLYVAGHSAGAVASAVGISKTTTLRYLREGGIPIRGSRKRTASNEALVNSYRQGLSLRELGQLFGMSNTTVRNRLIEANEPIRGKGEWRAFRGAVGAVGEDD